MRNIINCGTLSENVMSKVLMREINVKNNLHYLLPYRTFTSFINHTLPTQECSACKLRGYFWQQ